MRQISDSAFSRSSTRLSRCAPSWRAEDDRCGEYRSLGTGPAIDYHAK